MGRVVGPSPVSISANGGGQEGAWLREQCLGAQSAEIGTSRAISRSRQFKLRVGVGIGIGNDPIFRGALRTSRPDSDTDSDSDIDQNTELPAEVL